MLNSTFTDSEYTAQEIVQYIWSKKYCYAEKDKSLKDTIYRVANAVAQAESVPEEWLPVFTQLMDVFLPGGRVLNSLGTSRVKTTAMNCFVSQAIPDSMDGIFSTIHKAALTMQAGGGIGFDWSTLRPKGSHVKGVGSNSSGPVSFMRVADSMCSTISSAGHRRGAMMAVMRVDHPDIEDFITCKRGSENSVLTNFNLSVAVTNAFMNAVKENRDWSLVFEGKAYKTMPARVLWDMILSQTYDYAEPGVIFLDRVNRLNNLFYCEEIRATNPCGEQPLPPNGACNLGSLNLTKFIVSPFNSPYFDYVSFENAITTAVRFLDNIIDVARLPLQEQAIEVKNKRRIGLGITGLGNAIWMLGMDYGSSESVSFCNNIAHFMRDAAYRASINLAKEKGHFPLFDAEQYLAGDFIKKLPDDIREDIKRHGIRNSHLLTIAPTGTTSLLWGNISSGVEPIFALSVERTIKEGDGKEKKVVLDDYAYRIWKQLYGNGRDPGVLTSAQIPAKGHIDVMAAFQEYFDASISKTITFDPNTSFEDFRDTYMYAYEKGLKGCTVFRESGKISGVIKKKSDDYIYPLSIPDMRIKHAISVSIPDEGKYEIEITVVDNKPKEVWMHAPVEAKYASLIQAVVRLLSIGLRCNIDPKSLLKQLRGANMEYGNISSPLAYIERAILRVMGTLGVKADIVGSSFCPQCEGVLVVEEGCIKCSSCEYNKCS